jgi:hypothetical protein
MSIHYIGMDLHKEGIAIAVTNGDGEVVMESIIETRASTHPASLSRGYAASRM